MKNNHIHLKRLAAISLVVVMCLSALPMLAPSAAAASEPGNKGGYVVITFDDGMKSVYDYALPIMSAAGIPGTAFVITDLIGSTHEVSPGNPRPCMSSAELLDLQSRGWEIGSHSATHADFTSITIEQARDEFSRSKSTLEGLGISVDSFAYPYGSFNSNTVETGTEYYKRQRSTYDSITSALYMRDYSPGIPLVGTMQPTSNEAAYAAIDRAIETDSVTVLLYHGLMPDGNLATTGYSNLHDIVNYIATKQQSHGLQAITFRDLPSRAIDTYVWDGEGQNALASNPDNWYRISQEGTITNNAPLQPDAHYVFNKTNKAATWDLDASTNTVHSVTVAPGYNNTITLMAEMGISTGGFTWADARKAASLDGNNRGITSAGDVVVMQDSDGRLSLNTIHLTMSGEDAVLWCYPLTLFKSINVTEGSTIRVENAVVGIDAGSGLRIGVDAEVEIGKGYLQFRNYGDSEYQNSGRITSSGGEFIITHNVINRALPPLGMVDAPVEIRQHPTDTVDRVVWLESDIVLTNTLTVYSRASSELTLSLNDHAVHASSIVTRNGAAIMGGNGTIVTTIWDTSDGQWDAQQSTVVLHDRGSAVLAPGQSFHRLQVASDDGRTASWNMTTAGVVSPTVTGLRSGNYLWYLDGVEQGEVKAGKDGTIALSYVSTGLHTLEVKPTQMTEAMDGLAAAVGIIAVLAVLGGLFTMLGRLKF